LLQKNGHEINVANDPLLTNTAQDCCFIKNQFDRHFAVTFYLSLVSANGYHGKSF